MKIYKLEDKQEYLKNWEVPRGGQLWELELEMRVWNFVAKVVNRVNRLKFWKENEKD